MDKVLVTGGAGFIGSHLVDCLVPYKKVVVIDNLSTGNINNINNNVEFIKCDINDPNLCDIFDHYKFDYVFHTAAQINLRHSITNPKEDANTNIIGSLNVIDNCIRAKVKRIIFSSTGGAIYSENNVLPYYESDNAEPSSPYGLSKLTIENYLKIFGKIHNLKSTILRYSNVYGPRQNILGEAGVISIFIEKALKNQNLTIFGDGNQTRDFVYVDDVVKANILALYLGLDGIFNVSSNTQHSINTIAEEILISLPSYSKIEYKDPIAGEMLKTQLNYDKIAKHHWSPKYNIYDGIKLTIDYFMENVK